MFSIRRQGKQTTVLTGRRHRTNGYYDQGEEDGTDSVGQGPGLCHVHKSRHRQLLTVCRDHGIKDPVLDLFQKGKT